MFRAPDLKKMLQCLEVREFQGTEFGWGIMVVGGNEENGGVLVCGNSGRGATQYAEKARFT